MKQYFTERVVEAAVVSLNLYCVGVNLCFCKYRVRVGNDNDEETEWSMLNVLQMV